jgi:uncharacterized protein (DUF2249 family)
VTASGDSTEFCLVVDARGLEPPEPMVRVLESLDQLPFGERLLLLIHREPRPLMRVLDQNGYDARCACDPDGTFRVVIWQRQPTPPSSGAP